METPKKNNILLLLWAQFIVFILMLAFVSYYITHNADPSEVDAFTNTDMHKMFIGGGIFFAVLSILVPNLLLRSWKKTMKAPDKRSNVYFIIRFAFIEIVALLGFCCVLLSKNFQNGIAFYATALMLYLLCFPSKEKINNINNLR